eukprot:15456644-Alexandrium_andersonii.AAC.1
MCGDSSEKPPCVLLQALARRFRRSNERCFSQVLSGGRGRGPKAPESARKRLTPPAMGNASVATSSATKPVGRHP